MKHQVMVAIVVFFFMKGGTYLKKCCLAQVTGDIANNLSYQRRKP